MKTLRGVTAVADQITVRPDFAAGNTRERIGRALSRHTGWGAHHIVDVRDSRVTLMGTTDALAEREAARGDAWSARGVHAVVDNLEVESGR
ncbi:OsmY domain-containing protein [Caballeronia arationis]|jgi:hyperosmotically inducible protein|uniref:BON domain-containing protein n=1 Tax=Caballeronia arationis TaxID=1777142 RepID=UPI00074BF0CC|nr:BON domain-containing protein [Caballeronia arationis]SAL04760.1 OsmY domain-containing protein [Caballeronia arationis]